ncbi:phospholipid phosphatase 6 [Colletes gigas]|uniref:phospholipid phosphatase 6 n=1 Tax=Colletes gigas TaxID=935657 RepID=UPI001C9B5CCE|nr:phospholipid phosphatase 6 [Colletes gigas]
MDKRDISPILKNILSLDIRLTNSFVKYMGKYMPMKQLKVHYSALEISCNGLVWFGSVLALVWILHNKDLYQMQVNLLLGLVLDVIFIGVLKAITRRRRPTSAAVPLAIGPDKYSFPSGHASRAMFLLYFFNHLWPVPMIFFPPLVAWVSATALSRIMMGRHHILDIIAGLLLGYVEGLLMSFLYLEPQTCLYLVSFMTDEKVSDT